ncbi:MAG TPA: S41 family peptidase [Bacteroidaceae bacterium]|nr:S41 family peptidase [Bacteroidaceae bacterium]
MRERLLTLFANWGYCGALLLWLCWACPIMAQETSLQDNKEQKELKKKIADKRRVAFQKMQLATYMIDTYYVDSVDITQLADVAIRGMLKELDPHSTYSSPEEVELFNESMQGGFEGIGVQFNMLDDTLFVVQPVANGPSEKVGIRPGDRIVSVENTVIAGINMPVSKITKLLKGPKGTSVNLGIVRRKTPGILSFRVTRDKIPVYSINSTYMAAPKVGYIKLEQFGANSYNEFKEALKHLEKEGMESLVLDLRGNGGGYLQIATKIIDEILPASKMIVYTQGRNQPYQEFITHGSGRFEKGRVVVLIDSFSASASEIVSGALQDWDRGVLVGRRSFGKGLVQRPIYMPDRSMIRLTVARYYTPSGRCIQRPYTSREEYADDLHHRVESGELQHADSIHFVDSLRYHTKGGRVVYGGGGIMPDVFVPADTTTEFFRQLAAHGLILETTGRFVDDKRKELKSQFVDVDSFLTHFDVYQELLPLLCKKAIEEGITPPSKEKMSDYILLQLSALVARDLWDMNAYYFIMNKNDSVYKEALKIIQSDRYLTILKPN